MGVYKEEGAKIFLQIYNGKLRGTICNNENCD